MYGHVYGLTKGGLSNTPGGLFWTLLIVTVPVQTINRIFQLLARGMASQ